MRNYPNSIQVEHNLQENIEEVLMEDLPECPLNEWFLESVYFANMVDRIMDRLHGQRR